MKLYRLENEFSVCKIESVDSETLCSKFAFLAKTDDELSLVCETKHLPGNVKECETGWNALKIDGILDFSLTGVIAKIAGVIAEQGLSIFVISTFNTDYILMKKEQFEIGCQQLIKEGYEVI